MMPNSGDGDLHNSHESQGGSWEEEDAEFFSKRGE